MGESANNEARSLEFWIWEAACSIRGAKDAPKYEDYILPFVFTKRLCDVFDDKPNPIAAKISSRKKAFQLVRGDPENFIPPEGIQRIADTLIGWKEEDKLVLRIAA